MFRPLRMKHVLIQVLTEDLPQVSLTLAELSVFSPDNRAAYIDQFPVIPGDHYRELYHQASSRLEKIRKHVGLGDNIDLSEDTVPSEAVLAETNAWLGEMWERCSSYEETFRKLSDEERMLDQLDQALDNFAELKIDLSLLHGDKHFLDIRVGIIPKQNASQLSEALNLAGYLMFNYMTHDENIHIIVLGLKGERENEITSVLDTAGFHTLPVPEELHAEPDKVRRELQEKRQTLIRQRDQENRNMTACADEIRKELERCRKILITAEPFVQIDASARSSGYLSIITGWIPARDIKNTEKVLQQTLKNPFSIDTRDPTAEERELVPSYMPKSRLMAPFATLIKQYGIPRYGEIDPTGIFALTFIAMFGMMFGDIGHGLIIILAAWLARKKLKSFTLFAVSTGISATIFGALYGSIFGYEEIMHALWIAPLSDPIYMLTVALGWGIGFLLLITLISINNRIMDNDLTRAVFDNNGIVSIVLYVSVLFGIYSFYNNGHFGIITAIISITALLTLLGYKLIETHAPPGERMLVAAIETLETLTGYISNTLSFLRVAAFSLNHAALAIAVFTLAEMMESTGHWITVICGNIFILVLEGAIVTIQALRLEYYEGFSRFFSGDGKEFKPLHLHLEKRV